MNKNKSKILALKYRPSTFKELIGQEVISETISNAIKVLQIKDILLEDKTGNIMPPAENSLVFQNYIALSNLCEPSLKRFYIVMSTIWKSESILKDDLNIKCKKLAEDVEKIEGWPYPESVSYTHLTLPTIYSV